MYFGVFLLIWDVWFHNFGMSPKRNVLEILFHWRPSRTNWREFFIDFISKFHKVTFQNIIQGWPFPRVFNQDLLNQLDCFIRGITVFREGIIALFNFLICCCCFFCLERRHSEIKSVKNDAYTPNIHFKMVAFTLKDLWSYIVWCSTYSPFAFLSEL